MALDAVYPSAEALWRNEVVLKGAGGRSLWVSIVRLVMVAWVVYLMLL